MPEIGIDDLTYMGTIYDFEVDVDDDTGIPGFCGYLSWDGHDCPWPGEEMICGEFDEEDGYAVLLDEDEEPVAYWMLDDDPETVLAQLDEVDGFHDDNPHKTPPAAPT